MADGGELINRDDEVRGGSQDLEEVDFGSFIGVFFCSI
jgi:hypothetical protein